MFESSSVDDPVNSHEQVLGDKFYSTSTVVIGVAGSKSLDDSSVRMRKW